MTGACKYTLKQLTTFNNATLMWVCYKSIEGNKKIDSLGQESFGGLPKNHITEEFGILKLNQADLRQVTIFLSLSTKKAE